MERTLWKNNKANYKFHKTKPHRNMKKSEEKEKHLLSLPAMEDHLKKKISLKPKKKNKQEKKNNSIYSGAPFIRVSRDLRPQHRQIESNVNNY